MERIQKALDKAREERESRSTQTSAIPIKEWSASPSVPKEIEYTITETCRVSEQTLRNNRVIAGFEGEPLSDIYKILRAKVLHKLRTLGGNTLGITSPTQGAGKTLTAVNLAVSLALDVNLSVLLVDLDLRRPTTHRYLGLNSAQGLSDYLRDNIPLSDLLINPGIKSLVVLPGGKTQYFSSEMLSTPRMIALLDEIKNRYTDRIIVFDTPPLLVSDDALVILPRLDANLLVVEDGANTPAEVAQSIHLMENSELLGTVLNKSSDALSHRNYYYSI